MSWKAFVGKHLPEIDLFCTFNKAQQKKVDSIYELYRGGRNGSYYESIWGVMIGAELGDKHCRMLLEFVNNQVSAIRNSGNVALSTVRSAIFNMLVCLDNDAGFKTYIAEIAAVSECLQIPAWEVAGYEVPILYQGKAIGTTADLALRFPNGQLALLEIVSISLNMSRVSKWEDLEGFLLEKIKKKKESKLQGHPIEVSIFPVVWGDYASLAKYQHQLEGFFQDGLDFIGPFVITEFSRDGIEWHYDIMPAKDLKKVWKG